MAATGQIPPYADWAAAYNDTVGTDRANLVRNHDRAMMNHFMIAKSIRLLNLVATDNDQVQLRTLLKYYYNASLAFTDAIEADQDPQKNLEAYNAIVRLQVLLAVELEALQEDLTTELPSAQPNSAGFIMTSSQTLELLVACMMKTLPNGANLGHLQQLMHASKIYNSQNVISHSDSDESQYGLPAVLFVCLMHKISACSGDQWKGFGTIAINRRDARRNRMQQVDQDDLTTKRTQINDRLIYVQRFAIDSLHFNPVQLSQQGTVTDLQYNTLIDCMYHDQPIGPPQDLGKAGGKALPKDYGLNHLSESGRSFRGHNKIMFSEMSRCWKCRFLHHYQTPYPRTGNNSTGLTFEDPRQTAYNCNRELSCAEDLCHCLCLARMQNVIPAMPNGTLPFLPFN